MREKDPESGKLYWDDKVRRDIEEVLRSMGFGEVEMSGIVSMGLSSFRKIRRRFAFLQEGDMLFFQFPLKTNPVVLRRLFQGLSKRGIEITVIVHDLNSFIEKDASICKCCDNVIVNNEKTAMELIRNKMEAGRILPMKCLDFLIPDSISGSCGEFGLKKPVVVAGKLSREEAGYVYHLPDNCRFNLYGDGYEGTADEHVKFGGNYRPDEIPFMIVGSFGLVWDGPSPMTCLGIAGKNMKHTNPQQLSLYLASGMPVIVWSESAAADFVIQNGCGFTVSSLSEIGYRIRSMSEKTYQKMKISAEDIGIPMRDGCYLRSVILKLDE
ncbi:MAG: hypothetical protein IJI74_07180 [Firmicutes bacterium]|nr:hypothetical protein [Bacillota bacterium]